MPHYGGHLFPRRFDELQADVQLRRVRLRNEGREAEAELLLNAYVELADGCNALAVRMGVRGTEILREHERNSRVRPNTDGLGGPRLEDSLLCAPEIVPNVPGVLGVADYDRLDANVPWWWTQESGYGGNVGRLVFGAFFHPGPEARPSAGMDRQHAIFEPRGSAEDREGGKRGSMVIGKEIAAKHFLESAYRVIFNEWSVGMTLLQDAFVARVQSIP